LRGSANIIASIIFIIILVTLIFPLLQTYLSSSTKYAINVNQMAGNAVTRLNKALSLTLFSDGTLIIENSGTSTEKISYLILNSTGSLIFVPMNSSSLNFLSQFSPSLSGGAQFTSFYLSLPPGSSLSLNFPLYQYFPVAVTTVDGAIAYVQTSGASGNINYKYNSNLPGGVSYLLNPVTFFTSDLNKEIESGKIKVDLNLINDPTPSFIASGNLTGGVFRINNNGVSSGNPSLAYPLVLYKECQNVTVYISLNLTGSAYIGLQPEWESDPNRNSNFPVFNALLAGAMASPLTSGGFFNVTGSSCTFSITYQNNGWSSSDPSSSFIAQWLKGNASGSAWRIKILGLNATQIAVKYYAYNAYSGSFAYIWKNGTQAIGKYYYGNISEVDNNQNINAVTPATSIIMVGVVSSLKFYGLDTSLQGKPSTYDPYLLIADTDGNGYPELIFTTEDLTFSYKPTGGGNQISYNIADTYKGGDTVGDGGKCDYAAVDYTTQPLQLILSQVAFNGTQYLGVNVVASLYFHDSVYDTYELQTVRATDRALISIAVVDVNNSYAIVSSKNFTYQDLASLESTYPPNTSPFSVNVALPIPDTPHLYEVAVSFWDPYSFDSNGQNNDEVTIGLEFIGFQLYSR